uniref:Uncharacterized protein n=1 Tax=viral metagenome TaxID=1070528 RepID=A0A6M3JHX8_9ZZZZ
MEITLGTTQPEVNYFKRFGHSIRIWLHHDNEIGFEIYGVGGGRKGWTLVDINEAAAVVNMFENVAKSKKRKRVAR